MGPHNARPEWRGVEAVELQTGRAIPRPLRLVNWTRSHNTGSSITATQRKQDNSPNAAITRYLFQDNRLTKNTETIKTAKAGETPSRPDGPYASAGRQNHTLKYARRTSVKTVAPKTLDGVEPVIISSASPTKQQTPPMSRGHKSFLSRQDSTWSHVISKFSQAAERKAQAAVRCRRLVGISVHVFSVCCSGPRHFHTPSAEFSGPLPIPVSAL